jgi:hypothetical protein
MLICQVVLSQMSCPDFLPWLSCLVFPFLLCPSCLIRDVVFWPSCSLFPVPCVLTWLSFRESCPAILSQLSCRALFPLCHVLTVVFSSSCPHCPVEADLSGMTCQAELYRLSCSGCPVPVVVSRIWCPVRLNCHGYPAKVVLSQLSCPCCHVLVVLSSLSFSWLYYPDCSLRLSCPVCSVRLSIVADLSRLSCTTISCLHLFCPYRFLAVMFWWSYTSCPVLDVLHYLS